MTGTEPGTVDGTPVSERYIEAKARAERIRQGIDTFTATVDDLAEAVRGDDWLTLGYDGPVDYFEQEQIAERWRASEGSQEALVAALRAAGLTQASTGELLGLSQPRVSLIEQGKTGHEPPKKPRSRSISRANSPCKPRSTESDDEPEPNQSPSPDPGKPDPAAPTGDGQEDAEPGTSGVTVDVADQDRKHYLSTWDELRRVVPQLHTMTKREAEPPEQFFERCLPEVREDWRRTRDGVLYRKPDRKLPVALTGEYLVILLTTLLERGRPELGPEADRASLLAYIHALAAEVERLSEGQVTYDDLVEQFPDAGAGGAVSGGEPEAPPYLAGLFDDAEEAGDPA
jgi:hypothetical protein